MFWTQKSDVYDGVNMWTWYRQDDKKIINGKRSPCFMSRMIAPRNRWFYTFPWIKLKLASLNVKLFYWIKNHQYSASSSYFSHNFFTIPSIRQKIVKYNHGINTCRTFENSLRRYVGLIFQWLIWSLLHKGLWTCWSSCTFLRPKWRILAGMVSKDIKRIHLMLHLLLPLW